MRRQVQIEIILGEAVLASTYYSRQDQFVWFTTTRIMLLLNCSRSTASRVMDAVAQAHDCFYIQYDDRGRKQLMWVPEELWYCAGWDMDNILASRRRIDREFAYAKFEEKHFAACLRWHNNYLKIQGAFSEGTHAE